MKLLISTILFGKNTTSGAFAALIVLSVSLGCTCPKNSGTSDNSKTASNISTDDPFKTGKETDGDGVPSNTVVQGLVKDTMSLLASAVSNGDFSDLYSNASADFRSQYTIDEVTKTFKPFVDKKRLVLPLLDKAKVGDPRFTSSPSLRTEKNVKILIANGKFDTKPYSVRFDTEYVYRDGTWKMLKLVVNIP